MCAPGLARTRSAAREIFSIFLPNWPPSPPSGVDLVLLDEAARIPDDLSRAVRNGPPTSQDTQ